jgi:hypothetical protein
MKSFCLNGYSGPAREMGLDGQNRLPAILVDCGFLTNPAELPVSRIPIGVNASRASHRRRDSLVRLI